MSGRKSRTLVVPMFCYFCYCFLTMIHHRASAICIYCLLRCFVRASVGAVVIGVGDDFLSPVVPFYPCFVYSCLGLFACIFSILFSVLVYLCVSLVVSCALGVKAPIAPINTSGCIQGTLGPFGGIAG
jgi:hypothetical protein